ncbi:MAG: tetratricopeptide repeat protein, partial [Vicinamibacteria bacterium]
ILVTACGKTVEAPHIDDSDYITPDFPKGLLSPKDEKALHAAWNDVLTGQVERAEQTANGILATRPDFIPAQVVLGFAALRAERVQDADAIFASVLRSEPNDVAALVGQASAKRKQGQLEQALPLYLKAGKLRPRDSALSRRASETRLAVTEGAISKAGSLSSEGKKTEAILMLEKALTLAPDLSPVRLQLADLLIGAGRPTDALSVLAAAPEFDRNITLRIATIRFEDGDLAGAEMALKRGPRDLQDDPDAVAMMAKIREKRSSMALPEPLRAIGDSPRITRAELAALVVSRVELLASRKPTSEGEVASDLSRTWARPQILRVIELGLMDVYSNHMFQPAGIVRRGELAVLAARVLDLANWGRTNATPPKDMSPSHLQYAPVLRVLGAAVMQNAASGAFEPWRIVSGADAKSVVDSLARLTAQK